MKSIRKLFRNEKGQGMTEYIIIAVMIAIACIVVIRLFGNDIKNYFRGSRNEVQTNMEKVNPNTGTGTTKDINFGK
jgi:Flp pilus assembly pilin Flp